MTNTQKLQLEQSEKRQKINELLGKAEKTDSDRQELETLTKRMQEIEVEYRAAVMGEEQTEQRTQEQAPDAEFRERVSLRSKASLTAFLRSYLTGRRLDGPEAELREAAGVDGIPMELFDVETRADVVTGTPSTVGVNLDSIRPMVFANSIAPRLGIEMPRVESGTYASATITTALTAGAQAKSGAQEATAGGFTVTTATPKRVSARLSITLEDVASVGTGNFESILRENLSLVLSDELDKQAINGDGQNNNLTGMFQRLTDATVPEAGVVTFDGFAGVHASGVDGLWANTLKDVSIVVGPESYVLASKTFQSAANFKGELSAASYAMTNTGGFWTNKRMPNKAAHVQKAILYRKGRMMRTAVCPHWGEIGIDDIYSGSAKGERSFTMHVLLGDVILVQPDAYSEVSYRVSTA